MGSEKFISLAMIIFGLAFGGAAWFVGTDGISYSKLFEHPSNFILAVAGLTVGGFLALTGAVRLGNAKNHKAQDEQPQQPQDSDH